MRLKHFSLIVISLLLISCANRGIGPQGGPRDSIPPVPVGSVPEIGALNFAGNRLEVTFDEYIQLDNVAANMLISPPQQNPPDVRARGKRLLVNFVDSLQDSTTYTIDFGNAVCDFREKVPLKGYSFYFSTGDEIDTLEYTGRVYDAATLNPVEGMLVGIYRNLSDTAFTRLPFLRIAKTDEKGIFRIGNIHQGKYRIYAVDDISKDYRLTPGESLAFTDSIISIPADSTQMITLFMFKEGQQKLYLQKSMRDERHKITMLFSASSDSLPIVRAMRPSENDSTKSDSAWIDPGPYMYMYASDKKDTVTIWLTDSIAIKQDSMFLEVRYRRTDSLYQLEWYTDTLRALWRAPRYNNAKAIEQQERINRNRRLSLRSNARKGFELYDTLRLTCTTPIVSIALDSIHLFERIDTIQREIPFTIAPHDSLAQELVFLADLQPGGNYELLLDSGALHDVYGTTHIKGTYGLLVKTPADYSTLRVKLNPYEPLARIQVLNSKDEVIRELPADEEGTLFENLKPDTYYMRLYLDMDGNGKWTTGEWSSKRQPEPIFYFPGKVQTKSNWDFEEEWDYRSMDPIESKPQELVKGIKKK